MAVRLAFIVLLGMGLWAQENSSPGKAPATAGANTPTAAGSSAPAGANIPDQTTSPANSTAVKKVIVPAEPDEEPAPTPASSKKHNHSPVPEHSHVVAPAIAPSEPKSLPVQIAGQPLDRIRIYLIVTGAGVVVVALSALLFMWRQLRQIKATREQVERLNRRASEQLDFMRNAAEQIHQMLQQLIAKANANSEPAKSASVAADVPKSNSENGVRAAGTSVHDVQAAEETMRLQQRAWVFVTDIRAGGLQPGKPLNITLGFKNTGRTPARNVQIATQVDSLPRGQTPEPRLSKTYSRGIIPPEGTVFASVGNGHGPGEGLAEQDLQAITSGDLVVWAYGTLTYDDVFEVRQATMFCYRLQPDGHTFAVAEVYNDAT